MFMSTAKSEHPGIVQTSKQVDDYVLCRDCEQLLRVRGGDWVLQRLAVGDASPLISPSLVASQYLTSKKPRHIRSNPVRTLFVDLHSVHNLR